MDEQDGPTERRILQGISFIKSDSFDRSLLERGRSTGASIAMRVYHTAMLRMFIIKKPSKSLYRVSLVVEKEMLKKAKVKQHITQSCTCSADSRHVE